MSPLFERLCQEVLPQLDDRQYRAVGQWWFQENEIDVLGLTNEGLVAGECKFTSSPVTEGVLTNLEQTTEEVQWSDEPANGSTQYVLFSRSGFSEDLESTAQQRDDVSLYNLEDILSATADEV